MKLAIKFLLFILCIYFTAKFCEVETDGFRISRISSFLKSGPEITHEVRAELEPIFNQKFYYLGSGGQCWAFVSEDEHYVLKFFKFHRRKHPKLQQDFKSYQLAYDSLKNETGLVYLHLDKTESLGLIARVVDKIAIEHPIDLDTHAFLVQKKGVLVFDYIRSLMEQNKEEEARDALRQLSLLIKKRCQKGIGDEDPRLHRNIGFVGSTPIFIDTGRFKEDPSRKDPAIYQKDLTKITYRLKEWLLKEYPALAMELP